MKEKEKKTHFGFLLKKKKTHFKSLNKTLQTSYIIFESLTKA